MLQPGDTFGDYRVLKLLGKGGMGSVFLLENAEGGQVAAKILDPATAGDHEARKRFLREAQLALGVKHPNLVETYDVGEDPETGLCYILMEYVPGGSLADRIKQGPLPINDAICITYQIASVLELALEKGIVHRDIKPGNIMFGSDGKAKLADLGIARGGIGGTETTTVTQTGMMIGTPAYMAPEQMLDAHHVDTRADIYSLGIVFYEMLTGKRPNHDDTVVQLMAKAVAGEPIPDVRTLRPEVSASVAELVGLMCAMKAEERIATPVEVTTAISQIVHGHEVTVVRKRPSVVARKPAKSGGDSSRRGVAVLFGCMAVAGIAMFVYFGLRERSAVISSPSVSESGSRLVVQTNVIEKVVERMHVITNVVVTGDGVHQAQDPKDSVGQGSEGNGPGIRSARVGKYTWFYLLENGEAVITRGGFAGYEKEARPAIDPKPEGTLDVPVEIDGHRVSVIGNRAFMNCRGLEKIVIPDGIRELRGWGTFYGCGRLKEVVLPLTLRRITGWSVFMGCAFEELDLRNCESVEGRSFAHLPNLKRFSVASGNAHLSVRDEALYDRGGRRLIRWPQGDSTVRLAPGTVEIDSAAFYGIRASSVTLPSGVRRIASLAFENCNQLVSVTLPKGVETLGWSTFGPCKMLKRVLFAGDAPTVDGGSARSLFGEVPEDLEIVVERGSVGWNGPESSDLPRAWPVGDRNARRIRYSDAEKASDPEADDKRVPSSLNRGQVKAVRRRFTALDAWTRDAVERIRSRAGGRSNEGCMVVGRLKVEGDGDVSKVASWALVGDNGAFAACVYPERRLTFIRPGYMPVALDVPEAKGSSPNDDPLDLGEICMRKLRGKEARMAKASIELPEGIKQAELTVRVENDEPTWIDWGSYGWERRSVEVLRKEVRSGDSLILDGLTPCVHVLSLSAKGCASYGTTFNPRRQSELGVLRLLRTRSAEFFVRNAANPGGWVRRTVAVNGRNSLLLKEEKDRLGNTADLWLDPYEAPKGVQATFGWSPTEYFDLGMVSHVTLDAELADGKRTLPPGAQPKTGQVIFLPGHVYHMRQKSHWNEEWLIEFASYKPVLDAAKFADPDSTRVVQKPLDAPFPGCKPETKGHVANERSVSDASATKAVQKTLNALFPGWKTSENAKRGEEHMEGYVREHLGREDCVCTHPQSLDQPEVVLHRDLVVPKRNPVLRFSVAAFAPLSEFRVQARANGILVFEEDVAGGKWRDVCVDLSRWAGKQARVELVHRAIGWNWEWAFWWRMEVGEWDGREARLAKLVRADKLADRSRYADPDPTRAVRKTFKALFPGWTVSENGGGAEYIGYYEEFKHRHNLVMTHPPREGVPVVLSKMIRIPKNGAMLHFEVASHDHGDFELEVHVCGKVVRRELITPEQDFANIDVDLSEHAGKSVKVEIWQVPNNWQWEMAFWSKIEVK